MKFHRRIGFPKRLLLPSGEYPIQQTEHSKERSNVNDHGSFKLPEKISFTRDEIIEVKLKDKQVWRILVRQEYNDEYDVCYVIQFPDYELITSWRNKKEDTHDTLNKDQYNHPNEFPHYIKQQSATQ